MLIENEEIMEQHIVKVIESFKVVNRPQASVRKPQLCDDNINPSTATEFMNPCSVVDMCRSHLATGNTELMHCASIIITIDAIPVKPSMND